MRAATEVDEARTGDKRQLESLPRELGYMDTYQYIINMYFGSTNTMMTFMIDTGLPWTWVAFTERLHCKHVQDLLCGYFGAVEVSDTLA